jgi:RluA family pseudouridine synthase
VPEAWTGLRADHFLSWALPFLSRTRIRQKIQMGESLLNGRRYATSARVRAGDEITVSWRNAPGEEAAPALPILYEDEHLLAIDKPAGIASHPMGRIQSGTVIQFARQRHTREIQESLARGDGSLYPCLVNRLDRFSSGIVLVAKTRGALVAAHALAARGGIAKSYVALVEGTLEVEAGRTTARIALSISRDESSGIRVKMKAGKEGLPSMTEYRVLRRFPSHTLVRAFPLTGRQHQVRVHFAAIGHPVWGDLLYKDEALFRRYLLNGGKLDATLPPRHLLHAEGVQFAHPVTGAQVEIIAPLPADFLEILGSLAGEPCATPPHSAQRYQRSKWRIFASSSRFLGTGDGSTG